jgi:hypothetical protein
LYRGILVQQFYLSGFTVSLLAENKMLEALSSCEPEMLLASHDSSLSDPEFHIMGILSELYDRELVGIISWAKQIPGMWNSCQLHILSLICSSDMTT